jgi:hypothetical protein
LGHHCHWKERRQRKRSGSFGFGQARAAGLKAEGWGEANKTTSTKERRSAGRDAAAALHRMLLQGSDPYRHQQQQAAGRWSGTVTVVSGRRLPWPHSNGNGMPRRLETRLISGRSAAKPHTAVSPYSLCLDGWSGYFWFGSSPPKGQSRLWESFIPTLALHAALQCCVPVSVLLPCTVGCYFNPYFYFSKALGFQQANLQKQTPLDNVNITWRSEIFFFSQNYIQLMQHGSILNGCCTKFPCMLICERMYPDDLRQWDESYLTNESMSKECFLIEFLVFVINIFHWRDCSNLLNTWFDWSFWTCVNNTIEADVSCISKL